MTFSDQVRDRIDRLLDSLRLDASPGCAVGVVHEGELIYDRGVGLANLEWSTAITTETRFHLASLSKHFAAFAIALLAERGLVDLTAPAARYLPDLPDLDERVTVQHLVHHTHGLPDQWDLLTLAGWRMDDVVTTADVIEVLRDQHHVQSEPGAVYCYSNTGYTLLGLIVGAVTGSSLREFCRAELFEPSGMTDTYFNDDHTAVASRRARSYRRHGDGFHEAALNYATVGATNLVSTVRDVARWSNNLATGEIGGASVLARLAQTATLASGERTRYGFGLMFDAYRGVPRIYHGGGDAGFTSMLLRFPTLSLAVVVLSNTRDVPAPPFGDRVADLLLDELRVMPDRALEPLSDLTRAEFSGLFVHPDTGLTIRLEDRDGALTFIEPGRTAAITQIGTRRVAMPRYVEAELGHDSGGTATLHAWSYAGSQFDYVRTEPWRPQPTELAAFVGRYRLASLGTDYDVDLRAGVLCLRRRKLADMPLEPTLADAFAGEWGSPEWREPFALQFVRSAGAVTGLRLAFPKTHNIWLHRL